MIYIIITICILLLMVCVCLCKNNKQDDNHSENIRILGRQTLRWATAAYQDDNPMIAILHANYGVAYLSALKDIAREDEIEKVLDVDMRKIKKWVYNAQDSSTRKMIRACPEYGPVVPDFVRRLSGE